MKTPPQQHQNRDNPSARRRDNKNNTTTRHKHHLFTLPFAFAFCFRIVNAFAVSLLAQRSVDDLFWSIAENVGDLLGFDDCVVYRRIDDVLVQVAAHGIKNPAGRDIRNRIALPIGTGVVGGAAASGNHLPATRVQVVQFEPTGRVAGQGAAPVGHGEDRVQPQLDLGAGHGAAGPVLDLQREPRRRRQGGVEHVHRHGRRKKGHACGERHLETAPWPCPLVKGKSPP